MRLRGCDGEGKMSLGKGRDSRTKQERCSLVEHIRTVEVAPRERKGLSYQLGFRLANSVSRGLQGWAALGSSPWGGI